MSHDCLLSDHAEVVVEAFFTSCCLNSLEALGKWRGNPCLGPTAMERELVSVFLPFIVVPRRTFLESVKALPVVIWGSISGNLFCFNPSWIDGLRIKGVNIERSIWMVREPLCLEPWLISMEPARTIPIRENRGGYLQWRSTLDMSWGIGLVVSYEIWKVEHYASILRLVYHDLYLGGKALVERENVVFDLTKSAPMPLFYRETTAQRL
ncbi:hypothetical protein Tco_1318293 [Tanacetum coccineum]